jgi:hypothetical protein
MDNLTHTACLCGFVFIGTEGQPCPYQGDGGEHQIVTTAYVPAEQLRGAVKRCRCGFAGTNVTEDARCGCCGELVDDESLRWLVRRALGGQ